MKKFLWIIYSISFGINFTLQSAIEEDGQRPSILATNMYQGYGVDLAAQQAGWHTNLHKPRTERGFGGELRLTSVANVAGNVGSSQGVSYLSYYQDLSLYGKGIHSFLNIPFFDFVKHRAGKRRRSYNHLGILDAMLGWDFYQNEGSHVGINVGLTIPSGNRWKYTRDLHFPAFENTNIHVPSYSLHFGGNKFWGLGGGLSAAFIPWKYQEQSLKALFIVNWRYLYEKTQIRALGIKGLDPDKTYPVGRVSEEGLFSLSQLLNNSIVTVAPGHLVDMLAGVAYTVKNWVWDIGYNLTAQQRDHIRGLRWGWDNAHCAFPKEDYDPTTPFTEEDVSPEGFITVNDFDTSFAERHAYTAQKLYIAISYLFKEDHDSCTLGFSYQHFSSNKNIDRFNIFLGISESF